MATIGISPFEALFDKLPEEFNEKDLNEAAKILNEAGFPTKISARKDVTLILEKNFPGEIVSKIEYFLNNLFFLLRFSDDVDELKVLLDQAITKIENESKRKIVSLFYNSLTNLAEYYSNKRIKSFKTRANRHFVSLEYSCDMRGRFKEDYDYNKMPIEKYTPVFHDIVPLVSLSFEICDNENNFKYIFQIDEDDLDGIVAKLLAAQKELKLLKEKLGR